MKIYDSKIWEFLLEQNTVVELQTAIGARYYLGIVELPDARTPFVAIRGVEVTNMLSAAYPIKEKNQYLDDLNKMYEQGEANISFSNENLWIAYTHAIK